MTVLDRILAAADALTEPSMHVELVPYWENRNRKTWRHETVLPGLLRQVYDSVLPAAGGEALVGGLPGSRPPLAIEALSLHDEICMGVLRWCERLHLELRVSPESNVRALVGIAGRVDHDTLLALLVDLNRWRHWCAVFAGWERIYRPHGVPCMTCERINTLRINLTSATAVCKACDSMWARGDQDAGSIDLLGQHIREFGQGRLSNAA